MCSICNAKEHERKDSIQICYCTGRSGSLIGGQDHCITIYFDNDVMFCKRKCYSIFTDMPKYIGESTIQYISCHYKAKGIVLELDTEKSKEQAIMRYYQENGLLGLDHEEFRKQAILRHYQENDNFLILDEHVEISKSQFEEIAKIINEIKAFVSEVGNNSDEIVISTGGSSHYVIKDENGTTIIVDWLGRYNRSRDIEKALGLTSYLRCPCLEEDVKQMGYGQKVSFWQRLFRRSSQ